MNGYGYDAADVVVGMSREEAAEIRYLIMQNQDEFNEVDATEAYQALKPSANSD